jgi:hypothetical protein
MTHLFKKELFMWYKEIINKHDILRKMTVFWDVGQCNVVETN